MKKVLIVDDEAMIRTAHKEMIRDRYEVATAESAADMFSQLESDKPNVILLDVGLPDLDGFQVCQQLHEQKLLEDIAVIFVSGAADLDTRIKAFDSGADDFIAKPMKRVELLSKIDFLTSRKEETKQLNQNLQAAQQTVMTVMSSSSELGRAMQFVEHSFSLFSVDALVSAAFSTLNSFGLRCAIATEVNETISYFSSEGNVKPIEQELLELLKPKGRFYDFNQRTQVNYSHISLLIKNMPLDDPERYGRLKDLIPAIVGCLNSRLNEIEAQENIISQANDLIYSFDVIQATMVSLTESLGNNQSSAAERLHKMVYELQIFIQKLGLEEDQENRVISYVDEAVEESLKLLDAGEKIFTSFEDILQSLRDTVEKQHQVVERINREKTNSVPVDDVADSSDIDLF
ncbi:MAG: response regulator [Kangiellaceae bacterium]|nr:response regulator [Kangiellaceae bacterium]